MGLGCCWEKVRTSGGVDLFCDGVGGGVEEGG